jgi:predicted DNA-binding transcriptional regulator AlpA
MKSNGYTKRYVGIAEVSTYTSLPVRTIYDWSNQGKFPCIKYQRRLLFDLKDVDQLMDSLKRPYNLSETVAKKIIGGINDNNI